MNRLPGTIIGVQRHGSIALVDVDAAGHRLTATLVGSILQAQPGQMAAPTAGDAAGDAAGEAGGQAATDWQPGASVVLLFAETEVALAKNLSGLISMRNRIACTLQAIEHGTLLTRVTLAVAGHTLVSVVTTRSAHKLALQVGDAVEALIKANEMHVASQGALPSGRETGA